jgi:uncharacterized protein YgiM (DUF1202 family)
MTENLPTATLYLLLFSLTATVPYAYAASAEGTTNRESVQISPENPASAEATDSIPNLLPTLEVAADPCYVFINPKTTSQYFGPLLKGEKIKWLDANGDWIRVWIPRLRISGWVKNAQVKETSEPDSNPARVPERVLSRVSVITKRANVREETTRQSPVIFVAHKNEEFWLVNEEKGWYQVWLPVQKRKGWIFGRAVTKRSAE